MDIVKINFIDLTQSRITWGQNPNEGLWTLGWHLNMAVEDCHQHSVGEHSLLWVAPFPRQRVHTIYKWRNQVDHKQTNKQHMRICFWLLLTVGVIGPAQIPALTSCLNELSPEFAGRINPFFPKMLLSGCSIAATEMKKGQCFHLHFFIAYKVLYYFFKVDDNSSYSKLFIKNTSNYLKLHS